MAKGYLVFLAGVGVLASMLPDGPPKPPAAEQDEVRTITVDPPSHSPEQTVQASAFAGAVELTREADGHFYANVEINAAKIRALVDTGATGIALSRDDARRAGLPISAGMFQVVGKGANGDVRGEYVRLNRVSLGPKTVQDTEAVVLDAGDQTLLGQSFLKEFASVEIKGDRMLLR